MKSAILSLALLLSFIAIPDINAQTFRYGVQAGMNLCNPQVADKSDYTDGRVFYPLVSFGVNGYFSIKSNSFWGLSVEPGFIRKGGTHHNIRIFTDGKLYSPQDFKYISNYIQLPLFADFYVTDKLYISAGPELAYHLNSKAKGEYLTEDISDNYKRLELSGSVRLTYSLLRNLDCALTYNHGLTSSSEIEWADELYNAIGISKVYNQYFQVLLRFTF
ncbi:MAG TPA: porin family protein [Bacteroidales bacterium]|nr:porin family protein [Bacteroidales bacterium]